MESSKKEIAELNAQKDKDFNEYNEIAKEKKAFSNKYRAAKNTVCNGFVPLSD